ncbi:hypothetical protein AB0C96_27860 [Streptomyces sp. NPDC048506]|uniref:hypothetical protein n=1 Tax=Streptomyces sp. NPDC048506 TaxID=3155028 RepID=UPI0034125E2A
MSWSSLLSHAGHAGVAGVAGLAGPSASVEHIEPPIAPSIGLGRLVRTAVTSECHLRRMFLPEPR